MSTDYTDSVNMMRLISIPGRPKLNNKPIGNLLAFR